MACLTPTHSRLEGKEKHTRAGSSASRTSNKLDTTVRFPSPDSMPIRVSQSALVLSLTSAGLQITAARTGPFIPTSQAFSFKVLHQSRRLSRAEPAGLAALPSRRTYPPNQSSPRRATPLTRRRLRVQSSAPILFKPSFSKRWLNVLIRWPHNRPRKCRHSFRLCKKWMRCTPLSSKLSRLIRTAPACNTDHMHSE